MRTKSVVRYNCCNIGGPQLQMHIWHYLLLFIFLNYFNFSIAIVIPLKNEREGDEQVIESGIVFFF